MKIDVSQIPISSLLKFKEEYYPLIINQEPLTNEAEENQLCLITYCYFTVNTSVLTEEQKDEILKKDEEGEIPEEMKTKIRQNLKVKCQRQKILYKGEVLELREIYGLDNKKSSEVNNQITIQPADQETIINGIQVDEEIQLPEETKALDVVEGFKFTDNNEKEDKVDISNV